MAINHHTVASSLPESPAAALSLNGLPAFLSGDIDIHKLILIRPDTSTTHNLLSQVQMINIYQSILAPVLSATLEINDGIDLLQLFPIIGEELVEMEFTTPESDAVQSLTFAVDKISGVRHAASFKFRTYTLELVSEAQLENCSKLITKSLTTSAGAKGSLVSDAVTEILQDELSVTKQLIIEPTVNAVEIVLDRWSPLEAIDYLRQIAVSGKYQSSSYVFYETDSAYVFATIEYLFAQGRREIKAEFIHDGNPKINRQQSSYRNVIAFSQPSYIDTTTKLAGGMVANEIQTFDLITGVTETFEYRHADENSSATYADEQWTAHNTDSFYAKYSQPAVRKMIAISSETPETGVAEKIGRQQAYAIELAQNIIRVYVYGDSNLKAGDVISAKFVRPQGLNTAEHGENSETLFDSGNYLVAKVRHIISVGSRPVHTMSLELIKGSFFETGTA